MTKSIIIDSELIDAISHSKRINDEQKMNFLKYIGYLTFTERKELLQLV